MFLKKFQNKIKSKLYSSEFSRFKKISFSQCGEDLIVQYIFYCIGIEKPSFIDVGAYHPFLFNNTALLYNKGSRGINIEPDPTLFKLFAEHRKNDINLNIGIGDKNDVLDFYIISYPALNTFSKEEALKYSDEGNYFIKQVEKVKVLKLENVLDDFFESSFPQFLSIDAEGVDEAIIRSINFEKHFPLVICIETISFSTSGRGLKNTNLINYIINKGYLVYADTYINTIFVKKDLWQNRN